MDPSLIVGLVLAFGSVVAIVSMEGASVTALILPPPMILVFGATLAVGLDCCGLAWRCCTCSASR